MRRRLGGRLHVWYEDPAGAPPHARQGAPDLSQAAVAPGTRAYLCGPTSFTRALRPRLVHVPVGRVTPGRNYLIGRSRLV